MTEQSPTFTTGAPVKPNSITTFRRERSTALVTVMAGGRASPTATLLRNSRLLSLPPPLPRPPQEYKTSAVYESLTATLPYPSHAAIQTTRSSLPRGDWGLKQSLPSRTIGRTSNATIRIGDIESIDHITEFESASDLTMTLLKFQQFQLPITRPQRRSLRASEPRALVPGISVFESNVDNVQTRKGDTTAERWRFKGPWLAAQTETEFLEYIKKYISGQKTAFRKVLRERLAQKESTDRRERAINEGQDVSQDPVEVSEQRLDDYIRHLRQNSKELREIVEEFLDLPRATGDDESSNVERNYAAYGPPKTHPSAGLSYLRTASRIYNHPILGPQNIKPPVQGRFLTPQNSTLGRLRARALVGIGGIVADDSYSRYQVTGQPSGSARFDPDSTTGNKYWFHPERATITNSGRIRLHIQRAGKANLTLFNGAEDQKPDLKIEPALPEFSRNFPISSNNWPQSPSPATQGYGTGVGIESSRPRSNGRVKPLDSKDTHATLAMLNSVRPVE